MSVLRVRRRPDGVIELRKRRVRDAVLDGDTGRVLLLCAACTAILAVVVAGLVEAPIAVWLLGPCLALGIGAARWASTERLAPVPAPKPPSPPRAA